MNKKILTVTLNPCIDKTITVDEFKYGGLNRISSVIADIGGKGINVSKVLKNFGADVLACGAIAGKTGREVVEFLDNQKIENVFVNTEGEVRTNYKIVDSKNKVTTEINEAGFFVPEDVMKEFSDSIIKQLPSTEIMVLAGSVPTGVSSAVYRDLILAAKEYNVKVILDADGDKLRQGIDAVPYAIKPNLFEFEQLVGRKLETNDEIISAAKAFIDMGIGIVIISMGADGAMFVNDSSVYLTMPFEIDCKSTVAAGDSMVAALAYGVKQGYDFEKISRLATSAGTVTASKEGSNVCHLDEVVEKMPLVQVKKLQ